VLVLKMPSSMVQKAINKTSRFLKKNL